MSDSQSPGEPNVFRTPPVNADAEKALLAAMLRDSTRVYGMVGGFLKPEHFADGVHGRFYEICVSLVERGAPVDVATMARYVENDNILVEAGGRELLRSLVNSLVTIINAGHYGEQIVDAYYRRGLIDLADTLVAEAQAAEGDAASILAEHESRLTQLVQIGERGIAKGPMWWRDVSTAAQNEWQRAHNDDKPVSVTTGLIDVDYATGGLFPSDLIILAGRPSMGKTAFALGIALSAAKQFAEIGEGSVLFHSLEQPGTQLVTRDVSGHTGLPMQAIRGGRLDTYDLKRLFDAAMERQDLPIRLDSRGGLTVGQIASTVRREVRQHKTRLVIIDYLQFVGLGDRYRDKNNQIGEVTWTLKALAKELDLPIVLLSQLNREVEKREDKRPQLSDLRDSGNIEQDADVALFMFREEYYLQREEPTLSSCRDEDQFFERKAKHEARLAAAANKAEVIIAKQRNGPTRTVNVRFDSSRMRFENLAREG